MVGRARCLAHNRKCATFYRVTSFYYAGCIWPAFSSFLSTAPAISLLPLMTLSSWQEVITDAERSSTWLWLGHYCSSLGLRVNDYFSIRPRGLYGRPRLLRQVVSQRARAPYQHWLAAVISHDLALTVAHF